MKAQFMLGKATGKKIENLFFSFSSRSWDLKLMKMMCMYGNMLFIFYNSYSNVMVPSPLFLNIRHFLHFVIYYTAFWCNYTFGSYCIEFMCCLIENLFHNSLIIYYYLSLLYMKKPIP